MFSTATDFSSGYHVFDCAALQQTYCAGLSVIETGNYVAGQTYAMAVATEDVLVFATLDAFGTPIQQMSWNFPAFSFNIQAPHIAESQVNPGNYYICGSANYIGYVLKVDFTGNILWAYWYAPAGVGGYLEPRAIMESPYNTDELIIAGRIDVPGAPSAADAFFMRLSTINGAFLSCKYYNFLSWDSDDWFTCITKAASPTGSDGFFLGGRALGPVTPPTTPSSPRPTNSLYVPWLCKLDRSGNVVWSSLIKPSIMYAFGVWPATVPDICGVVERFNSNSGSYEYYGVSGQTNIPNRLTVYKLDDNGTKGILSPTEFHYLDGSQQVYPGPYGNACITAIETGGGSNDGIQVFGTRPGLSRFYFTKAYFNGHSGCRDTILDIDSVKTGPQLVGQVTIVQSNFGFCGGATLSQIPITPVQFISCYNSSLSNGSNAREALGISRSLGDTGFEVYPNPITDRLNFSYKRTVSTSLTISIINHLGQKVWQYSESNLASPINEIDFEKLGLGAGFYSIEINCDDEKSISKVVYTK